MKVTWVFDIDSTIAINDHRAVFLRKQCYVCLNDDIKTSHRAVCHLCGSSDVHLTQESFDQFMHHELMLKDTPITKAKDVIYKLRGSGQSIVFLTGRDDQKHRQVTEQWLTTHFDWQGNDKEPLVMRTVEFRGTPASKYKEEAFLNFRNSLSEPSMFVFFEDDPYVFKVYSKYGIVVKAPDAWDSFQPDGLFGDEAKYNR